MIYGWILIMVTLFPDGTLEGEGIEYYNEYEACFEKMVQLSILGQGKAYTCLDDYVDVSGDMIHEEDLE
tara:strand:+ start:287 stop:493 length:207 start_codon:yes stop_codon:yes gene_type:complete